MPLSQIVFGNDYPFRQAADHCELLVESGVFNAEELRAVESGNISALLPKFKV
jgi:hypothetical protein